MLNHFHNSQNSQFYAYVRKRSEITQNRHCTECQGHPDSALISADDSEFIKTPIYFVKVDVQVKITTVPLYWGIRFSRCTKFQKNQHFIFHQDGSKAHTTKDTIKCVTYLILEIIKPEESSLSSTDLNPLDYLIWSIVERLVYKEHITKAEYLK